MPTFLRVPIKEQILFARNVSLMMQTGMPILESLKLLQNQTRSKSMKKVLAAAITDVENGQTLAVSLRKFQNVFGNLFINLVKVGETSGTLALSLGYLADELKKKQETRSKIMNAMMYPIIIVLTTLALTSVITFLVFPKILPIFDSFEVALPLATRILVAVNTFMLKYWYIVAIALVLASVGFSFLLKIRSVRRVIHRSSLFIPVVGPLMRSLQIAIIARTLALLLKSSVKIVESLSIAAEIMPNDAYRENLIAAGEQIKLGSPLGKYFGASPNLYPVMFAQMVVVSESAGTLDSTLQYLSEYYTGELDDTIKNMISVLEPLLMLFMGGMIGFIAIAIILPIYSIGQSAGL